jgi:antitoxin Phd
MPKPREKKTTGAENRETPGTALPPRRETAAREGGHRTRTPGNARSGADPSPPGPTVYMTSTEAQNGFGRVLDTVARQGTVMITKHNATQAVVMSIEQYEALTQAPRPDLNLLTEEFDAMVERMQTPEAGAGLLAAFRASPEELSRAAVAAAKLGIQ